MALPLALAPSALGQAALPCPTVESGFTRPGVDFFVYDMEDVSAGGTPEFLVGGQFEFIAGYPATNFAVWDGTTWQGLGEGPRGRVLAVAKYDDGSGPTYYAGGIGFLQRWDGAQWVDLPLALSGQRRVLDLEVFDDGSGPVLYIAGWFDDASLPANGLAQYDGTLGPVPGGGISAAAGLAYVSALEIHDDGTGAQLFLGGRFEALGSTPARALARWDGATFAPVVDVFHTAGAPGTVDALASYTPPGGIPELHLTGEFVEVGGLAASQWAAWRPTGVTPLPGGCRGNELVVARRGGLDVLIAGSETCGTVQYDGTSVTTLHLPPNYAQEILALGAFGSGPDQEIFVSIAQFPWSHNTSSLGRLEGDHWVAAFPGNGVRSPVAALHTFDFGSGEELVATAFGYLVLPSILARFDGSEWRPLGTPLPTPGQLYPIEGGPFHVHAGELYVANVQLSAQEHPAARFDGTNWQLLTPGTQGTGDRRYLALESYDFGAGTELVVGGRFADIGAMGSRDLARWNGSQWRGIAGGTAGSSGVSLVAALEAWDDGTGDALFAAGGFTALGGNPTSNVGRFDGSGWSPLGSGIEDTSGGMPEEPVVERLLVFDSPAGEVLIAAGSFDRAGGAPANNIAAWDGTSWQPLGSGLERFGGTARITELAVHDPDGRGERLYAAGSFDRAGGLVATGLAEWDGSSWSVPLDVEPPFTVLALASGEVRGDRRLFLGGDFTALDGIPTTRVGVLGDPCSDVIGRPECTSTVNSTGRRATMSAHGSRSLAADDLTLTARHLPPAHAAILVSGTEPRSLPFGDGLLCVGGNIARLLPVVSSSANGEVSRPYDFGAPYAASAMPGVTLRLQCLFRDPAGGPAAANTTDAIAVTLEP